MWRNRIIFIILWILSVVGISWFGGPVSYGLFLLLTSIPVISIIYLLFVFWTYRIYQEIGTKNPVANHRIPYYITLQNEMPVLFTSIRVRFYSSFSDIEGITDDYEYELTPKSGLRLETELICKYRGEYEVGVKRIIITDLFRLLSFSFRNTEPLRVIVKPDPVTVESVRKGISVAEHQREARRNSVQPDVITRDYAAGDSIKRINWKQTARIGKLMVRTEEGEEKKGILLVADACRYSEDEHKYIPLENRVLEMILALARYYVRLGVPVNLATLQKNGELLYSSIDSEAEYDRFYTLVSDIFFDERLTTEKLAIKIAEKDLTAEQKNAIIIMGREDISSDRLIKYMESSGTAVDIYIADPECSLEESI